MKNRLNEVFGAIQALPGGVSGKKPSLRVLVGEHKSLFVGRGIDFYRKVPYDPREHSVDQIDWHDTRDAHELFVRESLLLKEMRVILAVDVSSSISFGEGESAKERLILETFGTVGLTAAHNHDRVGFIGFAEKIIIREPPKSGERRIYYLVQKVHSFFADQETGARRKTNFNKVFDFLNNAFSSRSLIFIFSDFIGSESIAESPLFKKLIKKHELVCVVVDDPKEYEVGGKFGTVTIEDRETGDTTKVSVWNFRKMRSEMLRRRKVMRDDLKSMGVDSIELECGNHIGELAAFLKRRRER